MFETEKEVDDDTVTKKSNISLKIEPTASLLSGNIEYSDRMNHSLMIEVDVTKIKESIRQSKDDSMSLLNDVEINLHDKR